MDKFRIFKRRRDDVEQHYWKNRVERKRSELRERFKDDEDLFRMKFSSWLEDEGYVPKASGPSPVERMIAEINLAKIMGRGTTRDNEDNEDNNE